MDLAETWECIFECKWKVDSISNIAALTFIKYWFVEYTSKWISYTSMWKSCTSKLISYTSKWISYTSMWESCTQFAI